MSVLEELLNSDDEKIDRAELLKDLRGCCRDDRTGHKKKPVSVSMSENQYQMIKASADKAKMSISKFVLMCFYEWLNRKDD